jgi:hypothetical protein
MPVPSEDPVSQPEETAGPPAPNPFDLDAIRENLGDEEVRTRRVLISLPVRKPSKHEFFRVNPDPGYTAETYVVEHEEGLSAVPYWVAPQLIPELRQLPEIAPNMRRIRLHYCKSRRGVDFLWPAKIPSADGSGGGREWANSALDAASEAMKRWIRLVGNQDSGRYEMFVAEGELGEPQWLDKSFPELIELGFKGRVIDDPEHEVLQELFGLL